MAYPRSSPTYGAALVTAAVVVLTGGALRAQEPPAVPPGPLTLEQVLRLAESRSEAIAGAEAGVRRAEGDQLRARSGRYPQLSASASYDRALASEFEGIFDGAGGPPCDPFTLNPSASLDARVAEIERALDCGAIGNPFFGGGGGGEGEETPDLPFGRQNTWRVNLFLSQTVYSGGRLEAQSALADAGKDSAQLTLTAARAQLLFDVTEAYYDAVLSDRLVAIADATLEQAEATLQQVQAGLKAGTQPEFELLRARVTRDNQQPLRIRQRANREIALLRLKQLLELPANYALQLADALDATAPASAFAAQVAEAERLLLAADREATVADVPLPERVAVREAGTLVRVREAALAAARAERLPSVSLSSSFGRVAYPSDLFPGAGDFRTNWTVGASVQLPILTGGRLRGEEMVAQAELEQSRLQLQQTDELAALDTRSAWAELIAARAAWEASRGTIEQASRAYEIAEVRYEAGVSTQLELSDARLLLQQSEANRALAARDLQVARARIALLPDLPLAAAAGRLPQLQQSPALAAPAAPSGPTQPAQGGQLRNAAAPQSSVPAGVRQ